MKLFEKTYDGQSIVDLGRDMDELFDEAYNPELITIPVDENGFMAGVFIVTVRWQDTLAGEEK